MNEDEYKKELAANGVDLPEAEEKKSEEKEEATADKHTEDDASDDSEEKEELPAPKEQKKRSIYDEYKDKKAELKSEKELREQAESERDDLKAKLEAFNNADTVEKKKDALDDIDAFAEKINADPQAIRDMKDLFLKDFKSKEVDPSLKKDLDEFKSWKTQNQAAIDKVAFDDEFKANLASIKSVFPNASDSEMNDIKVELDKLSHSKDWHDKSLDYVAFKHKEQLEALVSPRKRGLEGKGKKDFDESKFEFDPNADYSKMSMKEREQWEEHYNKATKSEGLLKDSQGRKIMI